jgi:hypothetical protein
VSGAHDLSLHAIRQRVEVRSAPRQTVARHTRRAAQVHALFLGKLLAETADISREIMDRAAAIVRRAPRVSAVRALIVCERAGNAGRLSDDHRGIQGTERR